MSEIQKALELSLATTRALAAHLGHTALVAAVDYVTARGLIGAQETTGCDTNTTAVTADADALVSMAGLIAGMGSGDDGFVGIVENAEIEAEDEDDDIEDDDVDLEDEDVILAGLAAQIDEVADETIIAASPTDITLLVNREDGLPIAFDHARIVLDALWSSIDRVLGPLRAGELTVDGLAATMVCYPTDVTSATALSGAGTGMDTFNATLPVAGAGTFVVTSRVGGIADEAAAIELGLPTAADIAGIPAVPAGQHPINGVLIRREELTGEATPVVLSVTVTYRRTSGEELTEDHVKQILRHPLSVRGLNQLGARMKTDLPGIDIFDGEEACEKVARIPVAEDGYIKAATVAAGDTFYGGDYVFPGIGEVNGTARRG